MKSLKILHGRILLKLEMESVKQTAGGLIYDTAFEKRNYSFGHVYQIDDETSKKHDLKVGDRVVFEKDRAETLTFKSKDTATFIDIALIFIHPDDIMAKVSEERTVMDYLQKNS